jgi:SAM-dependent methyltransferase
MTNREKIILPVPNWLKYDAKWITNITILVFSFSALFQLFIISDSTLAIKLKASNIVIYSVINYLSAFGTIIPFVLIFLRLTINNFSEVFINDTLGNLINLPNDFTRINALLVFRKLLLLRDMRPMRISDEFLTFSLIDEIISQNSNNIESALFILSCKSGTLNFELLKQIQKNQRGIKNYTTKVKKIYKVLNPIEYNPDNFKTQENVDYDEARKYNNLSKSLKWLHQIEYSKLFFGEAFDAKNNKNILVSIFGRENFNLFQERFNEKSLSEYNNHKDVVLIKVKKVYFLIDIERDPMNFDFINTEINILKESNNKIKEIEDLFIGFNNTDLWWKAEDYEYALMSAEFMKSSAKKGCKIFASDAYLDTKLGSWDESSPKWIVYEACEQVLRKTDNTNEPLVPVKRLFIIDKTDIESKERIWEFIKTLLLQEYINVDVKIVLENDFKKTINKLGYNNLFYDDLKSMPRLLRNQKETRNSTIQKSEYQDSVVRDSKKVPDFSCIYIESEEGIKEIISGINYQFGNSKYRKGIITQEEPDWNTIINILWDEIPSRRIGEYSFLWYLGKQFEVEKEVFLPNYIIESFNKEINTISQNSNFWNQYLFWENFWRENDVKLRDNTSDSIFSNTLINSDGDNISSNIKSYIKDKDVLEIGCCPDGMNSKIILDIKANSLTIIEQSIRAIEKFDKIWFSKLNYNIVHGIAQFLPDSFSGKFDSIVCLDLLNHWDDWDQILEQFYRVLKPNGILIANALSFNNHFREDKEQSDYDLLKGKWDGRADIIPTYNNNTNICFSIPYEFNFSAGKNTNLLMHYCSDEFINERFSTYFMIEKFRYTRIDPAHKEPFDTTIHEHEFYCIVARKV